ncbi:MAG TPA: FKBP-type peptidyl-prolyl cis-trans isomerase [Gammaproteobacteria bacterium]|nr:FKBP-type peptidyl-prolyl cis-trans isomerase [Gammaproteobacteria bacterium]
MHKALTTFALLLGLSGATAMAQPALETDQDKTLYALGHVIGNNVREFSLTPAELAIVTAGLSDAVLGKESRVDLQTYGEKIQALAEQRAAAAAAAEKEASVQFLQQMAQEPGAQRNTSGLVYIPMTAGTGASPTAADTVRVHYHGTLRDGTVFDSSVQRGEPISFPLNGVIPCWTEGVQKMKVGGKSKLICPSQIAYGDSGQGPIPPGATLAFEVELLGIEPGP